MLSIRSIYYGVSCTRNWWNLHIVRLCGGYTKPLFYGKILWKNLFQNPSAEIFFFQHAACNIAILRVISKNHCQNQFGLWWCTRNAGLPTRLWSYRLSSHRNHVYFSLGVWINNSGFSGPILGKVEIMLKHEYVHCRKSQNHDYATGKSKPIHLYHIWMSYNI